MSPAYISLSGHSGTGGEYIVGDNLQVTWNDTPTGDDNGDISSVIVDFSDFGGGDVAASDGGSNTWTAGYVIASGQEDIVSGKTVVLDVTDDAGNNVSVTDDASETLDNLLPTGTVSGSTTICADDSALITVSLTGNAPWNITYQRDLGNDVDVTGIASSPYTFYTQTAGTYSLAAVTESTGNEATNLGSTASVAVNSLPVINDIDVRSLYNLDDDPDTLNPDPAGGTYSGPGIVSSNNTFHPDIVEEGGPYTIYYTYTDANGCTNMDSANTEVVKAGGSIFGFNPSGVHCYVEDPFPIWASSEGTPYGMYGPGVSMIKPDSALFDPKAAGGGSHTVSYQYIKDSVLFTIQESVTVDSVGEVDFVGLADSYCVSAGDVQLSALAPSGGTSNWTGPGAGFFPSGRSATLQPSKIAPGDYNITYHYTSSLGCSDDTARSFRVNPLPGVSFTIRPEFNVEEPPVTLSGTPAGGTFSGIGVSSADSSFSPSTAGVNSALTITYTYTDANVCTNDTSITVSVVPVNAVFTRLHANNVYCYDGGADTVQVVSQDGIASSSFSGPGLTVLDDSTALFDPVSAGEGTHRITFNYQNPLGTPFEIYEDLIVDSIGSVDFIGLQDEYCDSDNDAELNALSPPGGTSNWAGPATGFFTSGKLASLQIQSIDPGDYNITYSYTSSLGCSSDTTKSFTIHPLPDVGFSIRSVFNVDEPPVTLSGTPAGGIFTGRGVSSPDSTFNPEVAGITDALGITYTYTDAKGCTNDTTATVRVVEVNAEFTGINSNNVYCYDEGMDTIQVVSIDGIDTGVFTGDGIVSIIDDSTAVFDPVEAGEGVHQIRFSYVNFNGTPFDIYRDLTVDSIGRVNFIGLQDEYCIDDFPFELTALSPPGGTHVWEGPAGGFFPAGKVASVEPESVGAGTFDIRYTYVSDLSPTCTSDTVKSFVIHPLPDVTFETRDLFNIDEEPVVLSGFPAGGMFSGLGVSAADSTFSPSIAGVNNNLVITYTYTDKYGCVNSDADTVVVSEYNVDFTGLRQYGGDFVLCYADGVDTIDAVTAGGIKSGLFTGPGIGMVSADRALFDPAVSGPGTHPVTYQYVDNNDVPDERTFSITVDSVPDIRFLNIGDLDEFCSDDENLVLLTTPEGGSFIQADYLINDEFIPGNAPVGLNPVEYSFTRSSSGCSKRKEIRVRVNGLPNFDFGILDSCLMHANDTTYFYNNTSAADGLQKHEWNFGDNLAPAEENVSSLPVPGHLYRAPGTKNVRYTATTNKGCDATVSTTINIGEKPHADFIWETDCYEEGTLTGFTNGSSIPVRDIISRIEGYEWKIGDSTYFTENVNHIFPDPGKYDIRLVAYTQFNCYDSVTKYLSLRPTIRIGEMIADSGAYFEDFEDGKKGWDISFGQPGANSWQFGAPTGQVIDRAYSGSNTWYMDPDQENSEESSWVLSPCFNFEGTERPMIRMKMRRDMEDEREGAVLQALTGDAGSWQRIGISDGINWYNSINIISNPGGQSFGWTGNNNRWETASHNLDQLSGESYVRMRIAYGSDGNGLVFNEGFSFDDIWIGERTRKVLLEHFTNSSDQGSREADSVLTLIAGTNARDVVDLHYHTGFPGEDPMNSDNPVDPSARTLYYGVSEVPMTILNGGNEPGLKFDYATSPLTEGVVKIGALEEPLFRIDIHSPVVSGNSLEVEVTAEGLDTVPLKEITLHVVVYEKTFDYEGQEFRNIVRKMLPNAGGTQFYRSWFPGDTSTTRFSWELENITRPGMVRVAAFLQDESSREVYQAETNDTVTAGPTFVVPLGDPDDRGLNFILYPNPARDEFTILFEHTLTGRIRMELYNALGGLAGEYQLEPGLDRYSVYAGALNRGIYLIRLIRGDRVVGMARLAVIN